MRTELREWIPGFKRAAVALGQWLVLAGLGGLLCGAVGGAFHLAVDGVTALRLAHGWLLYLMPAAGLVIVWSYRVCGLKDDSGTNQIIDSVRGDGRPPLRLVPLIFAASVLTHLTGGSAGREGAALQIGGGLSTALGRLFRLSERSMHIMVMCGMSGLFSALFGTPITAAVFSMEVVSVGIFQYSAFFPCLLCAYVAQGVVRLMGIAAEGYVLLGTPDMLPLPLLRTGGLAVLCGLLAILFCVAMHGSAKLYKKLLPNQYLRALAGGVLVVLLSLLEGSGDYNGAGGPIIAQALAGAVRVPWAFALKLLLTALTLGAGYRGGEIVPTFFVGACFGCAVGPLLGLDPAFAAAVSMIALFCGVVNCPLASILLSVELFGSGALPFFALSCALSYLLSGKFSLYSSQKLMYSKTEPRLIDENAR